VKPEEIGVVVKTEVVDQIRDDESGELVLGPGTGGLQPRVSEARRALPKLIREQEEKLAQAKRFAMEQSVQHVLAKQKIVQQQDLSQLQSSAQRQRALALMCRIYIGSINFQLTEESVRASFIPFGPIKMIDLSWDAATQKHKGFAFVEYDLPEAAQLALEQMNNVMMGGRNIKVGRPSNVPQAAPWIEQILDEARQYARIYVSSIHPDLTEVDIKSVFEAFGNVMACKLAPDQITGKHKGYGFIEYSNQQSANDAIVAMNLFDLGGQYIRVGRAITAPTGANNQGPPPAASVLAANVISASIQGQDVVSTKGASALMNNELNPITNANAASMMPTTTSNTMSPNPTMGTESPIPPQQPPQPSAQPPISSFGQNTPPTANTSSRDHHSSSSRDHHSSSSRDHHSSSSSRDHHASSLSHNEHSTSGSQPVPEEKLNSRQQRKKQELMDHKAAGEQNLEREEKLEISGKDARYMMMQKLARGSPSGILVLRNMVTIEEVDEDLEEEITEECSRFGEVSRVVIYQELQGEEENAEVIVKIFVEFNKTEEAETAQNALNGRWFGGKSIQANIYDEDKFKAQDYTG